ncbi:MAG: hypothetical protein ABSG75_07960 [Syntrophales bacterium]|jgi:hypothetical protein
MRWDELSNRVLGGKLPTYKQALGILESSDDDLLAVLHAALIPFAAVISGAVSAFTSFATPKADCALKVIVGRDRENNEQTRLFAKPRSIIFMPSMVQNPDSYK